jgi:hypothetical protein
MRGLYLTAAMLFLVQACSGLSSVSGESSATPVSPAAPTASAAPAGAFTPSSSPSVTPSPTIVRIPTQDFNPPTATPLGLIPIFVGEYTATPYSFTLPTPEGPGLGFLSVEVTDKKIYWGSCQPNRTRIIARVENPEVVYSVIIFVQVKSATKEDSTPWTTGNVMQKKSGGFFTYTLTANTTYGHNHYKNSFIRFQLVATNDMGEVIGRTKIFSNEIALSPCL